MPHLDDLDNARRESAIGMRQIGATQARITISRATYRSPVLFYIGVKRGVCSQINHFPEDADFDHDGAEYVLSKRHCLLSVSAVEGCRVGLCKRAVTQEMLSNLVLQKSH